MEPTHVELDQDLVDLLDELERPVTQAARELIVLGLYAQDRLSSGRAAELLSLTREGFIRREERWWLENRDPPEVFGDEFERALKILAVLPGAGTLYADAGVPGLRRIYLSKVACHIYYTFDDREVVVRAFWGARRGRGPFV